MPTAPENLATARALIAALLDGQDVRDDAAAFLAATAPKVRPRKPVKLAKFLAYGGGLPPVVIVTYDKANVRWREMLYVLARAGSELAGKRVSVYGLLVDAYPPGGLTDKHYPQIVIRSAGVGADYTVIQATPRETDL